MSGARRRPGWRRAVEAVSDVCGVLAAGMILLAVLITCQMIWVRYVSNASTVWQTELVIYLMIGATLIGLPYVQRLRGHVSVDLLPNLLPTAARRVLAVLVLVAAMVVIGAMLYHAAELWHLAWSRGWKSDTVWGPPLWIPYLALPLGLGLYLLQLGADLLGVVTGADDPFASEGSGHGAPLPGTPAAGTMGADAASSEALPGAAPPGHGASAEPPSPVPAATDRPVARAPAGTGTGERTARRDGPGPSDEGPSRRLGGEGPGDEGPGDEGPKRRPTAPGGH